MDELFHNTNTIVIVGFWNKHVLSEKWVVNNILPNEEIRKIEYPMDLDGSLRFSTNEFSFCIVGNRFLFTVNTASEPIYCKVIQVVRKILRSLPHTPIFALGFNFVFKVNVSQSIFDLSDNALLAQNIGHEISSSSIKRSFHLSGNQFLNIAITKGENPTLVFDFNFDYKVENSIGAIGIIGDEDDIIIRRKNDALRIMQNVYGQTL